MFTNRFMNWSLVSFTPVGGSTQLFTGVSSVKIDAGGSLAKFSGDADRFNTTVVCDFNEPSIEIQTADAAAVRANPPGTVGTFAATLNDARNGSGSGRSHIQSLTASSPTIQPTPSIAGSRVARCDSYRFQATASPCPSRSRKSPTLPASLPATLAPGIVPAVPGRLGRRPCRPARLKAMPRPVKRPRPTDQLVGVGDRRRGPDQSRQHWREGEMEKARPQNRL